MKDVEANMRTYIEKRFPRASASERERMIHDWLVKEARSEGIATDFERRVGPLKGLKVLDAGSGDGGTGIVFAKRGAHLEGVDIEEGLIAIARAKALRSGSSAKFTLYEGRTLPFQDCFFDAAFSVSVLEHVDNPVRYLSEILRVLKPGGHLYLAFPNRLWPKETHTGLWGLSYLPPSLARGYVRLARRNPLEDNGLHFYSYWQVRRFIRASATGGCAWVVRDERGTSANVLKRIAKRVLGIVGVSHQALLPHVMIILDKN